MKSLLRLSFLSPALILMIVSCTHAPQKVDPSVLANANCAKTDWYEAGRLDGRMGLPLSKFDEYKQRCESSEHPIEIELYENGREAGLIDFCSATGGLEAGKSGATYEKVCPENSEAVFLSNYELGKRIRTLETENNDLESRIENLRKLMPSTQTNGSLANLIEQLKTRRADNNSAIGNLESSMSSNQSSTQ